MTTIIEGPPISPIGSTAEEAAARRYRRSAEYREHRRRLAPYEEISRIVILARADRGWTQKQLADALGTTNTVVSRIESGRRGVSVDTLRKLATVLDVTFTIGPQESAAGSMRSVGANQPARLEWPALPDVDRSEIRRAIRMSDAEREAYFLASNRNMLRMFADARRSG